MRRVLVQIIISLSLASSVSIVSAADISVVEDETETYVYIQGEIVPGDLQLLDKTILHYAFTPDPQNPTILHILRLVRLNSAGGLIDEGTAIADYIHHNGITTFLDRGDECSSICFLIWAAGKSRYHSANSTVGVHSARVEEGVYINPAKEAKKATANVVKILKEYGIPRPIIDKLLKTPSTELTYLTVEELNTFSTIVEDDYAYEKYIFPAIR